MNIKNNKDNFPPIKKTSIGGQALIEGIMMRGPGSISIAVRAPNGEIVIENKNLSITPNRTKILKIPVLRGIIEFFRMMVIGVKALMHSADFFDIEEVSDAQDAPGSEDKPSKFETFLVKVFGDKLKDAVIIFSVVLSIIFSVALFMILPTLFASFIPIDKTSSFGIVSLHLIEGLVRISIFFAYIILTSRLKDIERVWQYHGAEHKTIHCYEHDDELTVDNVKKYTTLHPRCGTSFLFIVMIISTLVFSFTGWGTLLQRILLRIILVPLVAGISYEILKLVGRYDNKFTSILRAPGMFFQRFTTKEPDDKQIEVAIAAFSNVLNRDDTKELDTW